MSRNPLRIFLALAAVLLIAAVPVASASKSHHKHHTSSAKKAHKADRNRDGLPDSWERANHLSLRVNQSARDQDRDGANNAAEFTAGTNPRDADSNDDGVKDGAETVGTVVSFTDNVLTIGITGGDSVSATVTDRTEIRCGRGHHGGASMSSHGEGGVDGPSGFLGEGHHGSTGATGATGAFGHHDDGDDNENDGDDDNHGATGATGPTGPGGASCGIADLVPGAVVREAELRLTTTGKVWSEIKLLPAVQAPTT